MSEKQKGKGSELKGYLIVIVIFVAIVAGYTAISRGISGTNFPFAVVESGSMEPNIPIGSLLFIEKVAPQNIVVGGPPTGDVLIYELPDTHVTDYLVTTVYSPTPISHRAIAETIINGTYYFTMKGDANPVPDDYYPNGLVPYSAIIGKVVWHVPYIGYVFLWLKNPLVLLGIVIVLIIIAIIPMGKKETAATPGQNQGIGPQTGGMQLMQP